MLQYIVLRLIHVMLVVAGVVVITFAMLHLIPGNPAQVIAGEFASAESIKAIEKRLNLDKPLPLQFGTYVVNLVRGNLGQSFHSNVPVIQELAVSYPITARLAIFSLGLAGAVGIPLGVGAAVRRGTIMDLVSMVLAVGGLSIPNFWLGLNLILLFSVTLHWLPSIGSSSSAHFILPSISLATFSIALIARQMRSGMLEVLGQDYIRTARAKGLTQQGTVYRHALRNALIPVITVIGLNFGYVLGGTVITETVFSMRGMGSLVVSSILDRDYPVVQGGVLVLALNFALVNLLVDIAYAAADPHIRYA